MPSVMIFPRRGSTSCGVKLSGLDPKGLRKPRDEKVGLEIRRYEFIDRWLSYEGSEDWSSGVAYSRLMKIHRASAVRVGMS